MADEVAITGSRVGGVVDDAAGALPKTRWGPAPRDWAPRRRTPVVVTPEARTGELVEQGIDTGFELTIEAAQLTYDDEDVESAARMSVVPARVADVVRIEAPQSEQELFASLATVQPSSMVGIVAFENVAGSGLQTTSSGVLSVERAHTACSMQYVRCIIIVCPRGDESCETATSTAFDDTAAATDIPAAADAFLQRLYAELELAGDSWRLSRLVADDAGEGVELLVVRP